MPPVGGWNRNALATLCGGGAVMSNGVDRWPWLDALAMRWLSVSQKFRATEFQLTLIWAGLIGFLGGVVSVLFRGATEHVHALLTGYNGDLVASFALLSWWQKILLPTVGGALAGLTLRFASRFATKGKSSTDYMEAIVLGDGVLSSRMSLVKSLSALFSIASGAAIGREGPIVQLSSMLASLLGRILRASIVRLRLLVACGAAAGIASAYNAPITGALFVSEIVLRTLSMESFGPLVFASVVATLTTRHFLGSAPIYQIATLPEARGGGWEMVLYIGLGVLGGLVAPIFLRLLRKSESLFSQLPGPLFLRLAAGGVVVGLLAIIRPEVCGNGYSVVTGILHNQYAWKLLVLIFALKLLATTATFGSGAVGGVFTPTLFMGACIGNLYAAGIAAIWPAHTFSLVEFTLVGMGALLAATTHAPLMAMIIIFELTLDYQIILPLMIACVLAHAISRAFEPKSIYAHPLKDKTADVFALRLSDMAVAGIMKEEPSKVTETARFNEISRRFIESRFNNLYVVDSHGIFKGGISLHDIKSYLHDPNLSSLVIASDIMQSTFPTISAKADFMEALRQFSEYEGERLPVTAADGRLVGSLAKADLMLALADRMKQDQAR